jgi:hypothetical protein
VLFTLSILPLFLIFVPVASPLAETLTNVSAEQLAEYLVSSPSLVQRGILRAQQFLLSSGLSAARLLECSVALPQRWSCHRPCSFTTELVNFRFLYPRERITI